MKPLFAGAVGVSILLLLTSTAGAQISLDVNDQGTVYSTYFTGAPGGGPYLYNQSTLPVSSRLMFAGSYSTSFPTTPPTSFLTYISQAVVVLRTYTGGGPLATAGNVFLSFSASNATGTWTLWAHPTANGVVDTGDFVPSGGGGFGMIGQTTFAGGGAQTFTFNITTQFNNDLGSSFSGYTLTHRNSSGLSSVTLLDASYSAIPEPGTLALFGLGLVTFATGYRIRRKKKKQA